MARSTRTPPSIAVCASHVLPDMVILARRTALRMARFILRDAVILPAPAWS